METLTWIKQQSYKGTNEQPTEKRIELGNLNDTPGAKGFMSVSVVFCHMATVVLLVFSLGDRDSLVELKDWVQKKKANVNSVCCW